MKRIQSKLLAILLLSIPGAFTLQGMQGQGDQNLLDLLGNPHAFGALSLQQKNKDDFEKHKKQKEATNRPKKVRSLVDASPMGKFSKIPAAVWQNHLAPRVEYGPKMFPVRMQPMYDGNALLINKDRSRAIIQTVQGEQVINPSKNNELVYALPGIMCCSNPDFTLALCKEDNKFIVVELSSGRRVREIIRNSIWDDPAFDRTGRFIFMGDRNADNAGIRCFDLQSSVKNDCWVLPEASIYGGKMSSADGSLLALCTRNNHVNIYNTKTREKIFETQGSNFTVRFDEDRIVVEHNDRIKMFDINDKEKKELFDVPGKSDMLFCPLMLTKQNKVIFQGPTFGTIKIYDGSSGQELMELNGTRYQLSPDEKFIAVIKQEGEQGQLKVASQVYDIASKKLLFSSNSCGFCFTNDSNYFIASNSYFVASNSGDISSMVYDLKTGESWSVPGADPTVSSDGRLCALIKINDHGPRFSVIYHNFRDYSLEAIVIDLKTRKEVSRFETDPIPATRAWGHSSFSLDNHMLSVSGSFIRDTARSSDLKWPRKEFIFDMSHYYDKKFQDALANKFTPEQSALLMLLDEARKKNGDKPVSLLQDVALKQMLSLRELQTTLASFHPLVTQSIIERYKITDPTPATYKQKALDNKKYWANIVKATGFIGLVATLVAKWYFKKR